MYALTFTYGGVDDNAPYAETLAVSEDKDKLTTLMESLVKVDTQLPNIDEDEYAEWSDDLNYEIYKQCDDDVVLHHKKRINLYTRYHISKVQVY